MNWYDAMTVDLPECAQDGLSIEKFTVEASSVFNWRLGGRATRPGTYTALKLNNRLWMSDTDAEKRDHMPALRQIAGWRAERVLINGLGLGMVLKAALTLDHVKHVDVVEIDKRVIELVGAHYARDPRVQLHHADAYEQTSRWPRGTRWDVAWSDIWPDICVDNLEGMVKLRRSYGRRTGWHDCWLRPELVVMQRRDKEEDKR
jgi:hypothetical protein